MLGPFVILDVTEPTDPDRWPRRFFAAAYLLLSVVAVVHLMNGAWLQGGIGFVCAVCARALFVEYGGRRWWLW